MVDNYSPKYIFFDEVIIEYFDDETNYIEAIPWKDVSSSNDNIANASISDDIDSNQNQNSFCGIIPKDGVVIDDILISKNFLDKKYKKQRLNYDKFKCTDETELQEMFEIKTKKLIDRCFLLISNTHIYKNISINLFDKIVNSFFPSKNFPSFFMLQHVDPENFLKFKIDMDDRFIVKLMKSFKQKNQSQFNEDLYLKLTDRYKTQAIEYCILENVDYVVTLIDKITSPKHKVTAIEKANTIISIPMSYFISLIKTITSENFKLNLLMVISKEKLVEENIVELLAEFKSGPFKSEAIKILKSHLHLLSDINSTYVFLSLPPPFRGIRDLLPKAGDISIVLNGKICVAKISKTVSDLLTILKENKSDEERIVHIGIADIKNINVEDVVKILSLFQTDIYRLKCLQHLSSQYSELKSHVNSKSIIDTFLDSEVIHSDLKDTKQF